MVTTLSNDLNASRSDGGPAPNEAPRVNLARALQNGWVEFWYQPKIDLRKKHIVGVETFARARHPTYGVMPPGGFMRDADEVSLARLTEQALVNALNTSVKLSKMGINLPLAINIGVPTLMKLAIQAIVRRYRSEQDSWAGLIFDVTEKEVVRDILLIGDIAATLEPYGVKLAIDDFGRCLSSLTRAGTEAPSGAWVDRALDMLARLKSLTFAEVKLDRVFVASCATDARNAAICKGVIDLAHNFGTIAVAVGLEKPSDFETLRSMGCDVGQGFLFGEPLSEQQFIALLQDRAARQGRAAVATGA